MGFGAEARSRSERRVGEWLAEVQPEDLLKFGFIPEFIGRLPVIASLDDLDEAALVAILKEPKNALIKQYQKLFEFEKVKLRFTDGALLAISREAMKRKTGARGLRSILESIMLEIMYELPSQSNISECIVNEDVIQNRQKPIVLYAKKAETA
jgi:ATP-dependent Clp protease ATP-binding subunit ClpX